MAVTYSEKRYVTVCVGCETLIDPVRRDQMTCSPACRVRAHRNGSMDRRRAAAAVTKCEPAGIGFAIALELLRPDLVPLVMAGEAEFEDLMPTMHRAYVDRLFQAVQLSKETAA